MNKPATDKPALMRQPHAQPSSDATQIEQSRAVAQVQGALVVAQQRPRDAMAAMQRIREACGIQALAERAFFKYDRGGNSVTGPSIHLATELARCWGNVDYGIVELRRDEGKRESEMLTVAWDLETNSRATNSFIVPHKRDKRGGPVALTDLRDIYENNANAAARRLRECIFRILPVYVVEDAKTLCMATLQHGGGEPVATRAEKLLAAFAGLGVTRQQIEKRIGVAIPKITAMDIANLGIVYKSIERGELQVADEFPSLTAAAITADLRGAASDRKPSDEAAKINTPGKSIEAAGDDLAVEFARETVTAWADRVAKDGIKTPAPSFLDPDAVQPGFLPAETEALLDQPTEAEWLDAANAMLDRIDACTSADDLAVLERSKHLAGLDAMAKAAPQQHKAVTGFIAEKRKGLGG